MGPGGAFLSRERHGLVEKIRIDRLVFGC